MMQSLVPALYPILKDSYGLSFGQVGLDHARFPVHGLDAAAAGRPVHRPQAPALFPDGRHGLHPGRPAVDVPANTYPLILFAAALIGMGSSVFHPEASRVARMAAGGRYGLAQSLFQVGGNMGSAAGPLLAAFIVVPRGQQSIVWFSGAALIAMFVLFQVGGWYKQRRSPPKPAMRGKAAGAGAQALPRRTSEIR